MYLIKSVQTVHLNWKLDLIVIRACGGNAIPMASDLVKFIFKLDRVPKVSNSLRRFGGDTTGFVSEKSKSSAKIVFNEISIFWVY